MLQGWSPSLPIVGRGADGTVVEQRGLQVGHKTCERLLGIRCPGTRGPAQRLAGFHVLVPLLAPRRIDGALGLRLAMVRVNEAPALLDAPIARAHHMIAIAFRERSHRLGIGLGQDSLGLRTRALGLGESTQAGIGQLVQVLGALEGTGSDKERHARGDLQLSHLVGDDLAAVLRVTPIATEGLHQHGNTGLGFDHQVQHHLVSGPGVEPDCSRV